MLNKQALDILLARLVCCRYTLISVKVLYHKSGLTIEQIASGLYLSFERTQEIIYGRKIGYKTKKKVVEFLEKHLE